MFWREARILRLAKASQGCLAFAVVHSPMATESVGGGGRSAASKIAPAISDGFTGPDPFGRAPACRRPPGARWRPKRRR